ncbi:MAG: TlpA family protein disulfide reductase, partial [Candidatus Fonsibacter sp.]
MKNITIILLVLILFKTKSNTQTQPNQGIWRGVFNFSTGQEVPFNFEIKDNTAYLLNGSERFELKGITQIEDSIFIPIDIYDAVLAAKTTN